MGDDILNRGEEGTFRLAFDEQSSRNAGGQESEARAVELHQKQIEFLAAQTALKALEAQKLEAELVKFRTEERKSAIESIRERLKLLFDVGLALFGLALIGLVGLAIYSAARSQSVVVDAFNVPPDFVAQGESGAVVAGGLLDQLQALQDASRGSALRHHIEDAWSNDIKVDIPDTSVSLGELMRYLRDWLGSDIHITGSVVHVGDAVMLSVRGTGFAAKSFSGKPSDLTSLTTQAAEYVFGRSEPYLFASYLESVGRDRDAITLITQTYSDASQADRSNLLNVWGNALINLGDLHGAIDKYEELIQRNPRSWIAYNNVISTQLTLGEEEEALATARKMERLTGSGTASDIPPQYFQNQELLRMDLEPVHAALVTDMDANRGEGTGTVEDVPTDAEVLARLHERRAAELELETSPGEGRDPYVGTEGDYVRGLIEMDAGHLAAAYRFVDAADQAASKSTYLASNFNTPPACLAGLLAEMTGRPATADADIARGGHFEDCYRFKAEIADHRGNWPEAQKEFSDAVALAPSMPAGYFSWGEALMRHHDFAGAAAKYAQANARGPHWADPLKRWGDALAAQGDWEGGFAKYAEAAKYAPHWGSLQIAWGHALNHLGRHAEAVEKYRAALTMDLTGDEHWSLRGCCG